MKRILIISMLFLLIFSIPAFAGVEEIPDEAYLRDDFEMKDYKKYETPSIDLKGCEWPEGTTVICYESPYNPRKNVSHDAHIVNIPDSVVIISDWAFEKRGIKESCIDFTKFTNLKYIGKWAFEKCYFSRIDLSKTKLIRVGSYAFTGCYTKTLILPDTIKRIDDHAFLDVRAASVKLPEGLEYIGDGAFRSIKSAVIPRSVTHMGVDVFHDTAIHWVYPGSYGEEWCKTYGKTYYYVNETPEITPEQLEKTLTIGPVTFTGYAGTHYYDTESDAKGNDIGVMHVIVYNGGMMISDVDGADFMYTPQQWCLEYPDGIGRHDNIFNVYAGSNSKVWKKITDRGITPYPSEKLSETTWSKGYAWEFDRSANLIVNANGKNYAFAVYTRKPNITASSNSKIVEAVPTPSRVLVDGKDISFDAYNIEGNNYFKLRDVAMAVSGSVKQFNVAWNEEESCIDMLSGTPYTVSGGELSSGDGLTKQAETRGPSQILKDGIPLFMKSCKINGNNYFMLRDLGKEFDFGVSWDGQNNCILIETDKSYTE